MNHVDSGDEALYLARSLPNIPIFIGLDRVRGANDIRNLGYDTLVLDDGFQHLRLKRDLDLVLVHPNDWADNASLLPAGKLREPRQALERADVLAGFASEMHSGPSAAAADRGWVAFETRAIRILSRGSETSVDALKNKKVFLFAAIAEPDRFEGTIRSLGAQVTGRRWFRDHHLYSRTDITGLVETAHRHEADLILATAKDQDKVLAVGPAASEDLAFLEIEARPLSGLDRLEKALDRIFGAD